MAFGLEELGYLLGVTGIVKLVEFELYFVEFCVKTACVLPGGEVNVFTNLNLQK